MDTNNIINIIANILLEHKDAILYDQYQDGKLKNFDILTNRLSPINSYLTIRIDCDNQEITQPSKMLTNVKYHIIVELTDIAKLQYNRDSKSYDTLDRTFNTISDRICNILFNYKYPERIELDKNSLIKQISTINEEDLGNNATLFLSHIMFYLQKTIC